MRDGFSSRSWQPVDARLCGDDPFGDAVPARIGEKPSYMGVRDHFRLNYEYRDASGRLCVGERYSYRYDERQLDVRELVRRSARAVQEKDGTRSLYITAYYDVNDSTRSCIERGAKLRDFWFPIAMSSTFLALAGRALLFAIKTVK